MNIVVPIKQIPSLVDELELNSDGNGLDEDSLTLALSQAVKTTKDLESYLNMTIKGRELIETRSNTDAMLNTFHKESIKAAPRLVE